MSKWIVRPSIPADDGAPHTAPAVPTHEPWHRQPDQEIPMSEQRPPIPGTTIFDGVQARKGYALNKMCYSFNEKANRDAFVADEDAYCARFGLDAAQREAVRARNVLAMIAAGGNVYYLAKFAGIFGLDVQDIGAQQTGMTKDAFKAKLVAARG